MVNSTLKKNRSRLRDTVAVGVAQQGDTVGALNASTCPVLLYSRNPTLDTAFVLRPRRSIGFGDENVTVWKNVKPTRMVEADREGLDRKAGRRRGARALRPVGMIVSVGSGSVGLGPNVASS